jgi:hypothetical protein
VKPVLESVPDSSCQQPFVQQSVGVLSAEPPSNPDLKSSVAGFVPLVVGVGVLLVEVDVLLVGVGVVLVGVGVLLVGVGVVLVGVGVLLVAEFCTLTLITSERVLPELS